MKYSKLFISGMAALMAISLSSCQKGGGVNSSVASDTSPDSTIPSHTSDQITGYIDNLKDKSLADHLYVHYYRFDHSPTSYNSWDVWAWPYSPKSGEGVRFDWKGRTQSTDRLSATGNADVDDFFYATADIDLTATYDGGWNATTKTMGGIQTHFYTDNNKTTLDSKIGLQIVDSATRTSSSGFWKNDGGNLYVTLEDFKMVGKNNTVSYHVFLVQDNVQNATALPPGADDITDPFAHDDGTNVTYGNAAYANADWTNKALKESSPAFLSGGTDILTSGAGVGYQIMVASFADSDGDGFGDIYGIEQKLDYLEALGVNVLWLTPIQLSDSYHGYDISDYYKVDPKYGSSVSPAGVANHGNITEETAKADYKSLINAAHAKGMAVVMDLVINHTSTTNTWFIQSAQLDQALRGYYQWGNNQTQATEINETKYWYPYGDHVYSYYAKFGSSMPELNYAYASTRAAVTSMALNWCEFGVDGFRMDAVKHIFLDEEVTRSNGDTVVMDISDSGDYSSNLSKNLNFWREVNYTVKSEYPNAFFVGENFDGHAYHVAPYYEGFDSLFDFYSYFNLTSYASRSFRNGSTGAFQGSLSSFLGAYDASSTDKYRASADSDLAGAKQIAYEGNWNLKGVMTTNNKYRTGGSAPDNTNGFSAINGVFTSNHDIARCINRIAGGVWSASGLEEQGEVTAANYDDLDTLSTLVEITELMLPGCTWIYYGDELGMTGNLQGKKATDGYADLAYRQPMKWRQDGAAGDGSMTCDYSITGSGTGVAWDDINSTATVKDAETQFASGTSHFANVSKFAKIKGSTPALIKGNYEAAEISGNASYASVITRTLGSEVYKYYVNFGNTTVSKDGVSLPARSAVLTKNGSVIASFNTGGEIDPGVDYVTIYFRDASWWNKDAASTNYLAWSGSTQPSGIGTMMSYINYDETNHYNYWYCQVPETATKIVFFRTGNNGAADWGARTVVVDLTARGDNNMYDISASTAGWYSQGKTISGVWTTYSV